MKPMTEEQWGAAWAELAWKEGHRPMHHKGPTATEAKSNGSSRREPGKTLEILQECADAGMSLLEAASVAGVATMTAHGYAQRHGIQFRDGRSR
jgi:hypothetical protein